MIVQSSTTNKEVKTCFCRSGEQVKIYDGRPNTEMFLATGTVEEENLSDFLTVQVNLVAADKLYMLKKQVQETRPHKPLSAALLSCVWLCHMNLPVKSSTA